VSAKRDLISAKRDLTNRVSFAIEVPYETRINVSAKRDLISVKRDLPFVKQWVSGFWSALGLF
jgi:hypothetical protein